MLDMPGTANHGRSEWQSHPRRSPIARQTLSVFLVASALLCCGCGNDQKQDRPLAPGDSGQTATDTVRFADQNLESAVRAALGDTIGALSSARVAALTQLEAKSQGITSLEGIGQARGLVSLNLQDNQVSDLAPLAALAALKYLDLSDNQVEDLSPLASLTHLIVLLLDRNQVRDLAPLQGLTELQSLEATGNPLSESALAALRGRGVEVDWQEPIPEGNGAIPGSGAGPRILLSILSKSGPDETGEWGWYLWATTPDGRRWAKLTELQGYEPSVSPDGKGMVFTSAVDGDYEIWRLDAGIALPTNLTDHPAEDQYPVWSPDGRSIAFVTDRDGNREIYLVDPDGGTAINLTNHPSEDYEPCWSPDGRRLVFTSERDGAVDIFLMDANGANPVNLTRSRARDEQPAWSPDGRRIAFVSLATGTLAVYLIGVDGTGLTLVSTVGSWGGYPVWSPDGQRLAFLYDENLRLVDPDGSDPVTLRSSGAVMSRPCWAADVASGFLAEEKTASQWFADPYLETAVRSGLSIFPPDMLTESNLLGMTSLICRNCGITDLTGLERLASLRRLDLSNAEAGFGAIPQSDWNLVRDLGPLAELSQLTTAELWVVPEATLMPLAGLPKLRALTLVGGQAQDLSPLAELPQLTLLHLASTSLSDLAPLAELTRLSSLVLEGGQVADLSPVGHLGSLVTLSITGSQVRDLTPLVGLSRLRQLVLKAGQIEDVAPLAGLTSLREIDLSDNQIRDISALADLPALRDLVLTGNPLSEEARTRVIPALQSRGVNVTL